MHVIKPPRIREFATRHPDAAESLYRWLRITRQADWTSLVVIRRFFASADEVLTASGRPVVIFNIRGNNYRLITAVHYNRGDVFVLKFLTHAEYSKDTWKSNL
jgi:mRNA interferase HigB